MRRGVIEAVNELTLWEVFGSRREFLDAPASVTSRTRLVLLAKARAEKELADKLKDDTGGANSDLPKPHVYSSDSRRRGGDEDW